MKIQVFFKVTLYRLAYSYYT